MAGLVIELGKPSKDKADAESEEGTEPDEYDALAKEMLRAFKKDDAETLAGLLRECGFLGAPMSEDDEDYD